MPPDDTPGQRSCEALGTAWRVDTADPLPAAHDGAVRKLVDRFDAASSRFRPDSLVSRLARDGGSADFPPDAAPLLALYDRLYRATGGAVSPLVGGALERLGYGAASRPTARRGRVRRGRTCSRWRSARCRTGSVA